MKKLIWLFMFISITSQAQAELNASTVQSWDDPYRPFSTGVNFTQSVTVKWQTADNVDLACQQEQYKRYGKPFGNSANACSFWDKTNTGWQCLVITKKNPTMHSLGHEMRHCFQGNWH